MTVQRWLTHFSPSHACPIVPGVHILQLEPAAGPLATAAVAAPAVSTAQAAPVPAAAATVATAGPTTAAATAPTQTAPATAPAPADPQPAAPIGGQGCKTALEMLASQNPQLPMHPVFQQILSSPKLNGTLFVPTQKVKSIRWEQLHQCVDVHA